ncbi:MULTISPECIES: hydrogenase maturation protease [unclassified Clostridium]|uniref:hydrogenase maturation protease n=1 Tax=unclassified Clostridium TaxID=2614128 RepID=UPI0025BCE6BB|nr:MULTISPECIES: hydrogenase maturation protease [unclassified Clostridium]
MKKVIAIGNRIMMDDAIGIKIVESLKEDLEQLGFSIVLGETDIDYTLNEINEEDFIIIVDSSLMGKNPGSISVSSLNNIKEYNEKIYSLHQMSLVKVLSSSDLFKIDGLLITIEASEINFGMELSRILKNKFEAIKNKVLKEITVYS